MHRAYLRWRTLLGFTHPYPLNPPGNCSPAYGVRNEVGVTQDAVGDTCQDGAFASGGIAPALNFCPPGPLGRNTAGSFDVAAHELAHLAGLCSWKPLQNGREPSTLDEAFSDFTSARLCLLEQPGGDCWIIGDDFVAGGLRNVADPSATDTQPGSEAQTGRIMEAVRAWRAPFTTTRPSSAMPGTSSSRRSALRRRTGPFTAPGRPTGGQTRISTVRGQLTSTRLRDCFRAIRSCAMRFAGSGMKPT